MFWVFNPVRSLIRIYNAFLLNTSKSFSLIEVDITRGNLNPLPIAISSLSSDDLSKNKLLIQDHIEFARMFQISSKKIKNVQSMVDGYWLRFSTVNNLTTNTIGLSHNYNKEKKLFVKKMFQTLIDVMKRWKI